MLRNLWKLLLNLQLVNFTIMIHNDTTDSVFYWKSQRQITLQHFTIEPSFFLSFSVVSLFAFRLRGDGVLSRPRSQRLPPGCERSGRAAESLMAAGAHTHAEVADVWTLSFRFSVIFRAWCVCLRSLLRPLTFHLLVTQPLFLTVSADLYSNITVGEKNSKTEQSSSRSTCNSHSSAWEGSVCQPQSNLIPD